MYSYGHGSWIALVVFAGVLLIRVLASPRRRGQGGHRPGPGPASPFVDRRPDGPMTGSPPPRQPSGTPGGPTAGLAPGWFVDPTGRHGQRYWSGAAWTEHVLDNGVPGTDPPPPAPGSAPS